LESNWRYDVAEQGLLGYRAGPGLPDVRLCAWLADGVGYSDWLVDWLLPNPGWYVRIPSGTSVPYTYGVIFGASGNFPYGFDVAPDS